MSDQALIILTLTGLGAVFVLMLVVADKMVQARKRKLVPIRTKERK